MKTNHSGLGLFERTARSPPAAKLRSCEGFSEAEEIMAVDAQDPEILGTLDREAPAFLLAGLLQGIGVWFFSSFFFFFNKKMISPYFT